VRQELLGQAATKQPALLRHLRMTLEQRVEDQSSTMGQLLRNGLEGSSAASTTLLQVPASSVTCSCGWRCVYSCRQQNVAWQCRDAATTQLSALQGLTMLAELKGSSGSNADLLPESLKSRLPDR
jgi:hypothetical protein